MSRYLYLQNNDLTSLSAGVFDALTALRYVGAGERTGGVVRRCVLPPHMRVLPRI